MEIIGVEISGDYARIFQNDGAITNSDMRREEETRSRRSSDRTGKKIDGDVEKLRR